MAQTRKTAVKKGPGRPPKNAEGAKSPEIKGKAPIRREVGGVIALLLAAFSFIGYWSGSGVFISFFSGLVKGLVGPGYYSLPPLLLLAAMLLFFHRGRPVSLRVTCAVLLCAVIGALVHMFACDIQYDINLKMFARLWEDGRASYSGGVISGSLSEIFTYLFTKTGAAIVFICAGVFMSLITLNRTIAGIAEAVKNRPKREYVPPSEQTPLPEPELAERAVPVTVRKRRAIDIPVDDPIDPEPLPEHPVTSRTPLEAFRPDTPAPAFNVNPRVRTPDEIIASSQDRTVPEEAEDGSGCGDGYDVPLDIPFMESKLRRAPRPENHGRAADLSPDEPISKKPVKLPEVPVSAAPENLELNGKEYTFPDINLLAKGVPAGKAEGLDEIRINTERLEAAFRSFGVNVRIANTTRGPAVTRYEAELEPGVKLSRLTGLADDIALSLGSSGVRIAAMPNKISTVGIEVPNRHVSKVNLRDIIESKDFKSARSKLTFAIGKNIAGEAVVGNIAKLPHMLVAGTTGSGKSVCLNSMILSILYKARPEEVRFIMIDPKMVEFRVYNGIPHLLVPVVTDIKKASGALQWAVVEMMKRYRMFSETNARDLEGYNEIMARSEEGERLPQIIVVIDELADLMMTAAKEVEESICRVAQMGRAAGVHLIIATQSPRADVITGLMKANIPSRIALKVSSALESRIILDAGGAADKLVGNGDMLFAPIGTTKPVRVQGTWVSDAEREAVVGYIKASGETHYSDDVMNEIERAAAEKAEKEESEEKSDYDELLPQAVDVIFETGQASVSMLQRRLKLGYARAARIVDQMEQIGVVGPFEGSKPRQLMVTKAQWREMQYLNGTAPVEATVSDVMEEYSEVNGNDS